MDTEKIFKTKTGFCHILQDKIVLTRDGVIGNAARITIGTSIIRPLTIYAGISTGLILASLTSFRDGENVPAFLFLGIGILLLLKVLKSFNYSATPIIEIKKVKKIVFKNAISGATRSHFIVHFLNDRGKIKQRLILLPGAFNNGKIETEKALQIMKSEFEIIENAI